MMDPLLAPMIEPVRPAEPMTEIDRLYIVGRERAEEIAAAYELGLDAERIRALVVGLLATADRGVELSIDQDGAR
jgi:hypothetical protein